MAVDKFSGIANSNAILSRVSLEEVLARFDEQVSSHEPKTIRERLRRRLKTIVVDLSPVKN